MKVAVTGANGFLGSWICRQLRANHEVLALVRPSSNIHNLSDMYNLRIFRGAYSVFEEVLKMERPQVLILNDWWGVQNEFRNDTRQFQNIERVLDTVNFAVNSGVKTIIGIGSQAELGSHSTPIYESTTGIPTSTYGRAKALVKESLEDLLSYSNIRFVWARIFSTYGPLDNGKWLIPMLTDSLLNDQDFNLTLGEQQWSYLHAYDLARALNEIVINQEIYGVVHIGNPSTESIYNIAVLIAEKIGKKHLLNFGSIEYRTDQVMYLKPVCETLLNYGWTPHVDLLDGLNQTLRWLQGLSKLELKLNNGTSIDFKLPVRQLFH